MPANTFTSWSTPIDPPGAGASPGLGPEPYFRNSRDARLAMYRNTPESAYPDGYLGTITNRQADRVVAAGGRQNQRQYQRGVHKGERIDPGDYIWPKEFNLMSGIVAEAKGERFTPPGGIPVQLTNDGKVGPRGIPRLSQDIPQQAEIDAARRSALQRLVPMWR